MKKIALILTVFFCFCLPAFSQPNEVLNDDLIFPVTDSFQAMPAALYASAKADQFSDALSQLVQQKTAQKKVLVYTRQNNPVELWFFQGKSEKKALVVGGVHGSELSSIEVANALIRQLAEGETPFYNVLIIPSLFPDNAQLAVTDTVDRLLKNTGRYTGQQSADPNRQMPAAGLPFLIDQPLDAAAREIERENQALLLLIQTYLPQRLISLHSIRDPGRAGVFADPRTDCSGNALGFDTDQQLALQMAGHIRSGGGSCPGNNLDSEPTALYYLDPPIAAEGQKQVRSYQLQTVLGRGTGVSLGTWCSTAVCGEVQALNRPAIRTLTMEFPGYKQPSEYAEEEDRKKCAAIIDLYASSVRAYFLQAFLVEEPVDAALLAGR